MKYFCNIGRAQGFTLLEVLVAVAILAIAMVAILKANVQNLDALTESRESTMASLLAAGKLAEIEAMGPADWAEFEGDFGEDHPDYSWEVETARTESEGLMRVVVTVMRSGGKDVSAVRLEELIYSQ
jgi:general secretion pathway protein I